jgi:hypothetical protein
MDTYAVTVVLDVDGTAEGIASDKLAGAVALNWTACPPCVSVPTPVPKLTDTGIGAGGKVMGNGSEQVMLIGNGRVPPVAGIRSPSAKDTALTVLALHVGAASAIPTPISIVVAASTAIRILFIVVPFRRSF